MSSYKDLYRSDILRYGKGRPSKYDRKFLKYFRKYQTASGKILRHYYKLKYNRLCEKHCIEIPPSISCGRGLMLCHSYNITINPQAKLGDNINIHRGVLIGQTNRGKNKGAPVIGNCVWIGINASIVGGITVGDDVLIAPNSYVNVDVPDHSVVYGNPCVIKPRTNATEDYIRIKV